MRLLRGHTAAVYCLAYSPDGRLLAAGAGNNSLKLFDLTTGREHLTWCVRGSEHSFRGVSFLGGHRVVSLAHFFVQEQFFLATELRRWELAVGDKQPPATGRRFQPGYAGAHMRWFACFGCDPPGRTIAAGGLDGVVRLWPLPEERLCVLPGRHRGQVQSVAISPDGGRLASGGADWTVRVWDLASSETAWTQSHRGMVRCVAFAPDGATLATVAGPIVKLWDVADGRERAVLINPKKYTINSLAFSPDGRLLATAGDDRRVRFWDVATAAERTCYDWKVGKLHAVAFAPDGLTAAAAGEGRVVVVWDVDE